MFERFTAQARWVVTEARAEAVRRRDPCVGTQHLLLVLTRAGEPVADVLVRFGLTPAAIEGYLDRVGVGAGGDDSDAALLAQLGIDLDRVRAAVERNFGPGALQPDGPRPRRRRGRLRRRRTEPGRCGQAPFSPKAKKALELALREALRLRHGYIAAEHVALGILREGSGLAAQAMTGLGVDMPALRRALEASLRAAA